MRAGRAALLAAFAVALAALSACSGGRPRGPSPALINRVLAGTPGEAQPSTIVAAEIAYLQDLAQNGAVAASRSRAADGALYHGALGPFAYLGSNAPANSSVIKSGEWSPRTVVLSCDGALALSQGRYRDDRGLVGNYVTVWKRSRDGAYEWQYEVAGPDNPQPPPRAPVEDGDIVVTAIDSIRGLVATCPRAGDEIPAPPAIPISQGPGEASLSRDATLRWRWEHEEDGTKFIEAQYFYEGVWETVIEERLASALEE